MAISITKKDAAQAMNRLEGIKRRIAGIREKAQETTERLVGTAETAGAAFAAGVIQGKTGGVELFGVPLELGLGLGLNAFAFLGGAGRASEHLHNVGNGFLAAYATTMGRGVGATWGKGKTLASGTIGSLGGGSAGLDLSDVQQAAYAAAQQGG
jgi:hypothetical protein